MSFLLLIVVVVLMVAAVCLFLSDGLRYHVIRWAPLRDFRDHGKEQSPETWVRGSYKAWDPGAKSASQIFYTWAWLLGCFPIGVIYAAYAREEPEGRFVRRHGEVCADCGSPRPGHYMWPECPHYEKPALAAVEEDTAGLDEGIEKLRSFLSQLNPGPLREEGEAYLESFDSEGLTPETTALGLYFQESVASAVSLEESLL